MKASKKAKRQAYEQSKDKVLVLEAQIQALINGELTELHCPFCEQVTAQGQFMCCDEAATVINAILDHVEFQQAAELTEQIMDELGGASIQQSRVTLN